MACPDCGEPVVPFSVPERHREHAPGGGAFTSLCTRCLRVHPASDGAAEPDFTPVAAEFPGGEGGVAVALALGLLGSLALNRRAIVDLWEAAERAGVDVLLTLDRLAAEEGVDPHFDVRRRRTQLEGML